MIITIDEKGNEALDRAMIARQGPQQSNIIYLDVESVD
jgi:hypothetical protein